METNVPQPFKVAGNVSRSDHLSMTGGQWAHSDKYLAGDLHEHHYRKAGATHSKSRTTGGSEDVQATHRSEGGPVHSTLGEQVQHCGCLCLRSVAR